MIKKATDITQISRALVQKPLSIDELSFYRETKDARGENPRVRIKRSLIQSIGTNQKILFVGYRGCGKSTELQHLQKDIEDDFLVLNFSVYEELDPQKLNYIELIIVTMEKLFSYVQEQDIKLSDRYITGVSDFLKTKEIEDIRERYMGAEIETGADANVGIPYLCSFFAKFKAVAKGSRSLKTTLTETVEPHFSTLLEHCNNLINEIDLELNKQGKKDLVIIIEDLDKIRLSEARILFFQYANQITSLKTNIIFTFPIALHYDINFNTIKHYFSSTANLPMIKVHEKNGDDAQEGIDAMTAIIEARMELSLFENRKILTELIKLSGGCLRDLFVMISEAAENSQDDERTTINEADMKKAIQKLKKDYSNTIADHLGKDDKVDISAREYYEVLTELNNDPNKKLLNTRPAMHLRQNLTILGYNGEGWCDVHPIVKQILEARND